MASLERQNVSHPDSCPTKT